MPRCVVVLLVTICAGSARASPVEMPVNRLCSPAAIVALETQLIPQAHGLSPAVMRNALEAFRRTACLQEAHKPVLAVIDYTRASDEKRLWVFDLVKARVLFHDWVAHGKNSGDRLARRFSNAASSFSSSLGVFSTGVTYQGKHGLSLYLDGLEPGFNGHARERSVVLHGADYVSELFARTHGRLGRSWGCPAVSKALAPKIIETLREGAILFAWYPDPRWLSASSYLPAGTL